jgi:VCBS repeat-containing protein
VVAGVALGNTGVDLVDAGTVGVAIAGAFGILMLNADGSYSYVRTGGAGTDTFTYTLRDGDGSLSSTTLTIAIGDSVPTNVVVPPAGGADTQVFEAGLPARGGESGGSHAGGPAFPTTTQTGTITFTSPRVCFARRPSVEFPMMLSNRFSLSVETRPAGAARAAFNENSERADKKYL